MTDEEIKISGSPEMPDLSFMLDDEISYAFEDKTHSTIDVLLAQIVFNLQKEKEYDPFKAPRFWACADEKTLIRVIARLKSTDFQSFEVSGNGPYILKFTGSYVYVEDEIAEEFGDSVIQDKVKDD